MTGIIQKILPREARRASAVRWGAAGNIVVAWVLTTPAAAVVGGMTYGATQLFGGGAAGPVIVSLGVVALLVWIFGRRAVAGRTLTAEG